MVDLARPLAAPVRNVATLNRGSNVNDNRAAVQGCDVPNWKTLVGEPSPPSEFVASGEIVDFDLRAVSVPVLMLNGEEDFIFPPHTAQRALHESLGSAEKRQITYSGGNGLIFEKRNQVVRDALDWLNKYLGPVN